MTRSRILVLAALAQALLLPHAGRSATPPAAELTPEGHLKTTLPVPLRLVDPPLGDSLLARCRPGYAMLRCRIDQRGLVADARLLKSFPVSSCVDSADARRINDLALAVSRNWAFLPATSGGQAQSIVVDLPVYVPPDTLHTPRHDGVLVGTVVDSASGTPIPHARATLGGSILFGRSDRHGRFKIDHLVRLEGPVVVECMGWMPDSVRASVVPGVIDTLRLRLRRDPAFLAPPADSGTTR